jgi:beta-lactamase regulating signal transducer with metallopeptidase domain
MMTLFTYAGWTWLLVALGTTAVALALAAWRTWRPALRPQVQHRVAAAALVSCLVLVAIAPLAWTAGAGRPAPASQALPESGPVASTAVVAAPTLAQRPRESTQTANALAGAVGALWLLGVAVMGARLLGGWVVVRRLVRSARPIGSPEMQAASDRVQSVMRVRTPVRVLESSRVDVPIVVGCRPVLILPPDLRGSSNETLEPLLAHELAHVLRRDYLMNMLQSAADSVLFSFPGARWISARIRETREYCCDEMALQVCGDTRRYVEALAGIATLSVARQPVAALGVGGPRLATRIRRLLHGEPEVRHRRTRLLVLTASAALIVVAGDRVVGLALSQVAQAQSAESKRAATDSQHGYEVFMSWSFEQPGSAVTYKRAVSGAAFGCDTARVQNDANVAVTGLAFVAVVTLHASYSPVKIFTTDLIPVQIAAGGEADVDVHLFGKADQMQLGAIAPKIQVMCALTKVAYANGATWEVTPNPNARTADAALSLPPAEVSRSLVSAGVVAAINCRDDGGGEYSAGAIVPVRKEPGTFAECLDVSPPRAPERTVRWVEYGPGRRK